MRKAFTLIEVNLAMLVMATGILTVIGLFSFGYRENRQSREDVAATALADTVVSQVVAAIGDPNLSWSKFSQIKSYPSEDGWADYFDDDGIVRRDPSVIGERAFAGIMGELSSAGLDKKVNTALPTSAIKNSGLSFGLVITHEKGSPVVGVAFRATKQPGTLLAMPLYYCEARFQGDPNK